MIRCIHPRNGGNNEGPALQCQAQADYVVLYQVVKSGRVLLLPTYMCAKHINQILTDPPVGLMVHYYDRIYEDG
jgi:hypothetical protein